MLRQISQLLPSHVNCDGYRVKMAAFLLLEALIPSLCRTVAWILEIGTACEKGLIMGCGYQTRVNR